MKIAVLDHIGREKTRIVDALIRDIEEKTGEKVEVVHVNHDGSDFLALKSEPILIRDFDLEIPDLIDHSFSQKAKHSPKGHERPYKYHR